jgi:hypothetical protein
MRRLRNTCLPASASEDFDVTQDSERALAQSRNSPQGHQSYRILRKQARTSFTYISGCSKAAKWPPLSSSLK